jgi:hypothetical protein
MDRVVKLLIVDFGATFDYLLYFAPVRQLRVFEYCVDLAVVFRGAEIWAEKQFVEFRKSFFYFFLKIAKIRVERIEAAVYRKRNFPRNEKFFVAKWFKFQTVGESKRQHFGRIDEGRPCLWVWVDHIFHDLFNFVGNLLVRGIIFAFFKHELLKIQVLRALT